MAGIADRQLCGSIADVERRTGCATEGFGGQRLPRYHPLLRQAYSSLPRASGALHPCNLVGALVEQRRPTHGRQVSRALPSDA